MHVKLSSRVFLLVKAWTSTWLVTKCHFLMDSQNLYQIFDIEAEMSNINNASALDMHDMESTTSARANNNPVQRHASQVTPRRVSAQSSRARALKARASQSSVHSKTSKDTPEGAMSPSKAIQAVREGLSSALSRGAEVATNFTSPLAQIYQPLIVDDDLRDEQPAELTQPNMVSYGPASRRRLSSMHRFPPMAPLDMRRSGSRGQHALSGAPLEESPGSSGDATHAQERSELSPSIPEPASQVYEDEGGAGSMPQVVARLNRIDERQKRIEDLILQLSSELKNSERR